MCNLSNLKIMVAGNGISGKGAAFALKKTGAYFNVCEGDFEREIEKNDYCCFHHNHFQSKIKEHLVHPLIHSLKISLYVFIVNIAFALLIYYIKEDNIKAFINNNIYLTPLLSSIVGLIPTCASSIIITELFVSKALTFGATISGLICNAGLGLIYLFKKKENFKNNLLIVSLLFTISLIVGYAILFIEINI